MATSYKAGTVNHATNNEMARITVNLYYAGIVNHATMNKPAKISEYTCLPFIMQLITVHRTDAVRIVQSTGTEQPQAHPMML